jgi:hypothetical protein
MWPGPEGHVAALHGGKTIDDELSAEVLGYADVNHTVGERNRKERRLPDTPSKSLSQNRKVRLARLDLDASITVFALAGSRACPGLSVRSS